MTSIEERLDQYIDAMNRGDATPNTDGDAELQALHSTVNQLQAIREPIWPEDDVPKILAANLARELAPRSNGVLPQPSSTRDVDDHASNSWSRTSGSLALDFELPRHGWLRQTAQLIGAAVAVGFFGLILVLVFRGSEGGDIRPGTGPGDEPISQQLVFAASHEGNGDIYLVDADGSNLVNLTNHPAMDWMPAWSPDGSQIAFISDRDGDNQLYVMDADGSNARQLTSGPDRSMGPAWSPDGAQIAMLRQAGDDPSTVTSSLAVIDADGSDLRVLTDEMTPVSSLSWSPDNSEIVVSIGLSGRGAQILAFRADGSGQRNLYMSETHQFLPTWSPDGEYIAFEEAHQVTPDTVTFSVTVIDSDGQNPRPVSDALNFHRMPDWSPDGKFIAVIGNSDDRSEGIFIVSASNPDDVRRLEPSQREDVLSVWSPDSRQIAFLRSSPDAENPNRQSLMVINADGSGLVEVAADLSHVSFPPAWRPTPSSTPVEATPTVPEPAQTAVPVEPTATTTPASSATPIDSSPQRSDDNAGNLLTIDGGIAIVRDYLDDPEAELRANYDEGLQGSEEIIVFHDIGSETQQGAYHIDRSTGEIVQGGNPLTSTLYAPEQPISDDEAFNIAEAFVRERFPDMSGLELRNDGHSRIEPGTGDGDRVWQVSWQGIDPETGVMLPSSVTVVVNTRTGLINSWNIRMIEYDGPLTPEISEQQARDIATDSAEQAGIVSPEIEVELSVQAFQGDNVRLVWSISIENLDDGDPDVALYTIDAITGELLDWEGVEVD